MCAKSNSAIMAVDEAMNVALNDTNATVPPHLMDAHYGGAAQLGHE